MENVEEHARLGLLVVVHDALVVLLLVVAHEDHHVVVAQRPEDRLVGLGRLVEQSREVAPKILTLLRVYRLRLSTVLSPEGRNLSMSDPKKFCAVFK